ncbi:50S ribosomal protein L11 methyltransferase [Hydrogenimonas sp.]
MGDTYRELTVTPSAHHDLFLDFLQTLFSEAIETTDTSLIVRTEGGVEHLVEGVKAFAEVLSERLGEPVIVETEVTEKENVDWIARYRESIRPVEVGEFYVYPGWEAPKEGKRNIRIDPALAFGSGHHETTASCLEAIGEHVEAGDEVLDVGCGSGILGIAASMLGAEVDACDTDPLAVENAAKNFALNDCAPRRLWEGSAPATKESYDVVVANIVADVLKMIAKDLKARTKPGGLLILSGILDTKERDIEEAFGDLEPVRTIEAGEWRTKIYRKQG